MKELHNESGIVAIIRSQRLTLLWHLHRMKEEKVYGIKLEGRQLRKCGPGGDGGRFESEGTENKRLTIRKNGRRL